MEPDARDAPRLSRAAEGGGRGALLTQRLLAFSRKQALHPQAVAMAPLLENLSELMRHSLPATLSLEIEAQSPAWPAWIDVGQLENALDQSGDERPRRHGGRATGSSKYAPGISGSPAAAASGRIWWPWR